jgi:hypothetical protein
MRKHIFTEYAHDMIQIAAQARLTEDLFDRFDPSPVEQRRLNTELVTYLLASLKSAAGPGPVVMTLLMPESSRVQPSAEAALRAAVSAHFHRLVDDATADIKRITLIVRVFIPISLVLMCICTVVSELLRRASDRLFVSSIAEGVIVLGWVALWLPFDYLLFARLPLYRLRSLYRCLENAEVRIQYTV